ncbi:GLPGLI family protein [Riemerella columbina]|uniref:GLPGLI family protein n=1 Tax=Riemerella columbina TaxID=103810 RepID=UPI00266F1F8B|nr:GLPGLI family protein [Riemerella columbina]WKS95335.1 GLPGLI family protein [Riemerella columbina]
MKKLFSLVLCCIIGLSMAQNVNRFFYELTYQPNKDSAKTETIMTVLDIWKDKSVYRDYTAISQDSLLKEFTQNAMRTGNFFDTEKAGIKQAKFSYTIVKPYPITDEIRYEDMILNKKFVYTEKVKLDWKVQPETTTIENYPVQKATVDFGGRSWSAWFTTELPFADGPYKFQGLPGLIVKLEDSQHHYQWLLKGNEKLTEEKATSYVDTMMKQFGMGKGIEISKEKFEKAYNDYKKDPFASMKMQLNSPQMKDYKLPDGSSLVEKLKETEERMKKMLNENNNPIELK